MQVGLVYQDRKRWPKFVWVHQALERLGHSVVRCTSIADVQSANGAVDLLLFEQRNAGLCEFDLLKIGKHPDTVWAQWWFDLLSRDEGHLEKAFGPIMQKMDVLFTKGGDLFAGHGVADRRYLDQGCPSDMPQCEHHDEPEFDAMIVGSMTKHYLDRQIAAHMLTGAGLRVAVIGGMGIIPRGVENIGWVDPLDMSAHFSRAAVVIHSDITNDVAGYRSDAFWLKMGAGACVVAQEGAGNIQSVRQDVAYLTYSEPLGLLAAVKELRRDAAMRRRVGENARRYTMASRTYETQCAELIDDVERIKRQQAVPNLSR